MTAFPYVTDAINAVFGTGLMLPLPTFGTMVVIAAIAATYVAKRTVRRYEELNKLPVGTQDIVSDTAVVSVLAGIVGARVFDILENLDQFFTDPISLIFTRSGFSIYGGLLFGVVAGVLFVKRRSVPLLPMLDAAAPAMMLGYAIGRLGCQFSGDGDWGIAANLALKPIWIPAWLWSETYNGNIVGAVIVPPGVYPTPIYESLMAFVIFGVLWLLQSNRNHEGFLFSIYLLLAGFERLLIEKIRLNPRYEVFGVLLTQAEFISLLLAIIGLSGTLLTLRTNRPWIKVAASVGVLIALAACAPR